MKGHTGEIYFDAKSHQLVRESETKKEVFDDPILQVDRQYANLRTFFSDYQIDQLPTYRFAVFTNANVILKLHDYPEHERILTAQAVPTILERLTKNHSAQISHEQNKQIRSFLISQHQERFSAILEKHHILWEDLKKGVPCPDCRKRAMMRERMRWQCTYCGTRSTDAHVQLLYKLALLTNNRLTTAMVQDFLQIPSADATRKLIARAAFHKTGVRKGATYYHPEIAASGHKTQASGHKTSKSGHKVRKSGHKTQKSGHKTSKSGHKRSHVYDYD
ncbi:NERD domain-containing protein [Gracilibacillus salinarum]|uniref:NERD domain-containing protein n=1 Tax=Gracilibacillus salinarum TaxID=2932255 RepID=A0ABY4GVC6_9BACI|nr:NERD domain-containing protein [Gracilibacillus salinarum]UOQ87112.1 NERD domain-containing protein [Gracilibacillus salinarum]